MEWDSTFVGIVFVHIEYFIEMATGLTITQVTFFFLKPYFMIVTMQNVKQNMFS